MKKYNRPLAAAIFCLCAVPACVSAQAPAASGAYDALWSSGTRNIYSAYLGDTVVVFAELGWGTAKNEAGDAEKYILPFMQEFPRVFKGKKVLDIGTGSGIIALYAARLGAAKVIATDIVERAVENTRLNARKLKLDAVVEARLVSRTDMSAYAVIRPDEVFDTIISNAAFQLDDVYHSGGDYSKILGLSILQGLKRHLKPGGALILHYRSKFIHDLITAYALNLGYKVERHQAVNITAADWCSLYKVHAAQIARREQLPEQALQYPGDCVKDFGAPYTRPLPKFPPLWGKTLQQAVPGLILIRNNQ